MQNSGTMLTTVLSIPAPPLYCTVNCSQPVPPLCCTVAANQPLLFALQHTIWPGSYFRRRKISRMFEKGGRYSHQRSGAASCKSLLCPLHVTRYSRDQAAGKETKKRLFSVSLELFLTLVYMLKLLTKLLYFLESV